MYNYGSKEGGVNIIRIQFIISILDGFIRVGRRHINKIWNWSSTLTFLDFRNFQRNYSRPPVGGESNVSQHSASTRWWRRVVSLKIPEIQKCECWRSVWNFIYKYHFSKPVWNNLMHVLLNVHHRSFPWKVCYTCFII